MATPVKVRRLSDEEGRQLQRIVRRGGGKSDKSIVKWRRALVVLASAGGNDVAAIARLVQTSPDRVREMIHPFNDKGMRALDPQWAGGRPRRITTEERQLIIKTATKRPRSLGQPFTRWSIRKLAQYLATKKGKRITISRERLRQILAEENDHLPAHQDLEGVTRSAPRGEAGPHRVPARARARERTFAFDEFGPLAVKPEGGSCWAQIVQATAPAGQLPQAARDQAALRLVLPRRRPPLWPHRAEERRPPDAAGPQGDPGRRARRRDDLRDLGQLEPPPRTHDPPVVRGQRRRAGLHAHLWIVGQPDRGPLRAAPRVRHRQLRPPEPRRNGHRRSAPTSAGATPTPPIPRSSPSSASTGPHCGAKHSDAGANPEPAPHSGAPPRSWTERRIHTLCFGLGYRHQCDLGHHSGAGIPRRACTSRPTSPLNPQAREPLWSGH